MVPLSPGMLQQHENPEGLVHVTAGKPSPVSAFMTQFRLDGAILWNSEQTPSWYKQVWLQAEGAGMVISH